MMKWRAWGTALVLAIGAPAAASAQGVIQSITSSQQAGADVVRVELSEALSAVPAGFVVQAPPRIAIDLPGVGSALGRPSVELNQGNLRSVNVAQAGERTRLVLNLKQSATYRAQLDGKTLLIIVDSGSMAQTTPATATATAAAPTGNFAPSQNRETQALREIDFRRGGDGSGRIVVSLPTSQVGVDIRQQGTGLVVEFLRSAVPDSLRRRDQTDGHGEEFRGRGHPPARAGLQVRRASARWSSAGWSRVGTPACHRVRPRSATCARIAPGPTPS